MTKRILLVDDSASVRTVAGIALREAGYEVLEASNGQEGMSKLNGERVHLVISDVNMPVLDGIGFLKQIKAHPNYRFTPVIMLTTEAGEDKKAEGRAAGAKAWIYFANNICWQHRMRSLRNEFRRCPAFLHR